MADVADEGVEPPMDPRVPHGLLHLRDAAELDAHLPASVGLVQTGRGQLVDPAIHVILQLAIKVAFQPVAPAAEQIEESGHRLRALVEDQPDRRRQPVPTGLLAFELLMPRPRERIELRLAARLRLTPL